MSTGVIVSSGQYTVSSGQIDTSDIVDGGGLMFVDFGGVAIGTTVNSGGTENVFGTDISGTITSGGIENVFFGGVASDATVTSGGNDTVFSGGFASGTVVSSGGTLHLYGGAVTSGTTVLPGGQLKINSGYTISNYVVSSGVYLHIASGGTAVGAVISGGGFEGVDGGGGTIGTIVRAGGVLTGQGFHSGTVISTGGWEVVAGGENANAGSPPGGPAVGTIVSSGGRRLVAGGLASNTAIDAGGTTDFLGAGAAILIDLGLATSYNSVLYSVPNEGSFSGAVANNGALVFDVASAAPAKTIFAANLTGSGSLVVSGDGTLVMSGGDSFTGDVTISGGTLELSSASAVGSGGIAFASQARGTLQIDGTTMPTNLISGFAVGDTVDLAGVTFSSVGGAALGSAGVVTVTEGGQIYTLDFDPTQNFGNEAFTVSADASGGTDVFLSILQVLSSAYTVIAGQSVSNVTVVSGGDLQVSGAAIDTIVSAGREGVYSGGVASDTIVRGGKEGVLSGGLATGTVVSSGGFEDVNPGGTVRGATISAGGVILVDAASAGEPGGTDIGTTIDSGGQEYIEVGGTARGTTINSGGFIDFGIATAYGLWSPISATTIIYGVTIQSGAIVAFELSQGGSISGFVVVSGSEEVVHSGGGASDTTVSNGGTEGVQSGGTANGTVVSSGGLAGVLFGGTVSRTTISNGGLQLVGGTATDTTIDDGGILELFGAGTELDIGGMVVNNSADGSLSGTIVNNGSLIFDLSSSAASSTIVAADIGGSGTLVVSGGGSLDVASVYTGSAQIDDTSTLEFTSTYSGVATFSGAPASPGGTLKLDVPSTGPINVLNANDTVIAQPGGNNWINAAVSFTLPANIDVLFLYAGAQGTGNSDTGDALYALDAGNAQTLTGYGPNDTFVVYNSSDVVMPKAGSHDVVYAAASYTLPTGVDVLFLEGTAVQGTGNSDAAGDALYAANPGQVATLIGNSANDVFVVYNSSDVVVPKAGSHDLVYSAVNYTLPTGVDVLFLEAGTQGVGNSDASGDALYAADAGIAQTLTGNSANDVFVVYNSADVVAPKAGSHVLFYSAANFTLPTGVDSMILEAGTQAAGNSDAAGDTLFAADAAIAQTLTGHSHNDSFVVYNSADTVIGQTGSTDKVYAAANFTLPTNVDTLFLEGNASQVTGNSDTNNSLYGNAGVASTLVAGSGADTLYVTGIAGTIMTGGTGRDTFAFPDVLGKDEVTNFGVAKDTLQFNATLFSNFTVAMNAASQVGANTVFTVDANDTVTLDNVIKTSLTAGNVHFT